MSTFNTAPLESKPFILGFQDCFTVVRDFFKLNFDLDMPDIARPNDWEAEKDDLIGKFYDICGFEKLDPEDNWPPRPADLLVCTFGGSVPNHLVVFLGGNEILHHKINMLSGRELMRPAWKRATAYILRHPQVPDLTQAKPTMELMEAYEKRLV